MRRKLPVLFAVTGGVIVIDQSAKSFIRVWLQPGDRVPVIEDVLTFTYLLNPGAAFGLGWGGRVLWLGIGATALLAAMFWFMPAESRMRLHGVALALGGALGNLIDRFRHPPGVVDFVHLQLAGWSLPVFNLADTAVMIGSLALMGAIWWEERELRARTARDA